MTHLNLAKKPYVKKWNFGTKILIILTKIDKEQKQTISNVREVFEQNELSNK